MPLPFNFQGPETGIGWVWPLPIFCGRVPVVSSQHAARNPSRPTHLGVDVMYPRKPGEPDKRPRGTKPGGGQPHGFVMFEFVPVLAAAPGTIWSARDEPTGFTVVIDHGNYLGQKTGQKWATRYTHMKLKQGFNGIRKGQSVLAGTPLGWCRGNPRDNGAKVPDLAQVRALWHCHVELWAGGRDQNRDPETWMKKWQKLPFNIDYSVTPARRCA